MAKAETSGASGPRDSVRLCAHDPVWRVLVCGGYRALYADSQRSEEPGGGPLRDTGLPLKPSDVLMSNRLGEDYGRYRELFDTGALLN